MSKKLIASLLIVFFSIFFSYARDETGKENFIGHHYDITVTADRIDTSLKHTATAVTVITRDDLDRSKKTTLLEILEEIPGVSTTQNGPIGASASVSIRGGNPDHTKILLDGVEINDPITPTRSLDLSLFLLENIERIEILRGPQSTLYGSDAMAGVINIITRKNESSPKLSLTTGSGSYGEITAGMTLSHSHKNYDFSLSTAFLQTEGLSAAGSAYEGNTEKDGFKNNTLSANFALKPADNMIFHLSTHMILSKAEIDNFGGPYGDDPNNIQKYNAIFLGGGFRTMLLKNRWEQKLDVSLVRYQRSYDNPPDPFHVFESDRSEYTSSLIKVDWQNNFYLHKTNTLIFGAAYQQEAGESEYYSSGFWETTLIFPRKNARITSFYAQDVFRYEKRFYATAGIRWDRHDRFGSAVTFRIAPALLIPETGTKLKATYGTAFKSPSLYQLYAPPLWGPLGNVDLNPERSRGWDVGLEQAFLHDRLMLEATYFRNDFDDLIQWDWLRGYINIASASTQGTEFLLQAYPQKKITLHVAYTRTKAIDNESNIPLLRRPKDNFSVRLDLDLTKWGQISISYVFTGQREDIFFTGWASERVTMPAFSLLNTAFSFTVSPGALIYIRLHNILDTEYEWVKGYGTRGFSFHGGIQIRY